MRHAVFLRGVNVGGHKVFQPTAFARSLAELEAVNIGAAGTFAIRAKVSEIALHETVLAALPFRGEVMTCPADELLALWRSVPFGPRAPAAGTELYFTILARAPAKPPKLPFAKPSDKDWQIRVIKRSGRFVLSLRRARGVGRYYPNDIIEKEFDVPATTRSWATVVALCRALESD